MNILEHHLDPNPRSRKNVLGNQAENQLFKVEVMCYHAFQNNTAQYGARTVRSGCRDDLLGQGTRVKASERSKENGARQKAVYTRNEKGRSPV